MPATSANNWRIRDMVDGAAAGVLLAMLTGRPEVLAADWLLLLLLPVLVVVLVVGAGTLLLVGARLLLMLPLLLALLLSVCRLSKLRLSVVVVEVLVLVVGFSGGAAWRRLVLRVVEDDDGMGSREAWERGALAAGAGTAWGLL